MYGVKLDGDVADLAELVHPPKHLHRYILHDDHVPAENNLPFLSFPLFLNLDNVFFNGRGDLMHIFPDTVFQQDSVLW